MRTAVKGLPLIKLLERLIQNIILLEMAHSDKPQSSSPLDIIDKAYAHRTASQHRILTTLLQPLFPTLSQKVLKLLTFYLQRAPPATDTITHKQFSSQSYVIMGSMDQADNPESPHHFFTVSREKKIVVGSNQYAIVLDYAHYLNCQNLGESSVEEEIAFMHGSEFMCSVPRKRLYQILRRATVMRLSTSQAVYREGQKIEEGQSGSGVFMVRKGDFGYLKNDTKQQREIEVLHFSKGHLFGTFQMDSDSKTYSVPTRQFTVRCKSHTSVLYRFSEELFANFIRPYCENVITQKQSKLARYMSSHMEQISKLREAKNPWLSQTLSRGFSQISYGSLSKNQSQQRPLLNRTRLSLPFNNQAGLKPTLSQQIQQKELAKTDYYSLRKQGPLKNYPMLSQRSNFLDSQFREFTHLENKKQTYERVRSITHKQACSSDRGQILFSFFKQAWNFDREKKLAHLSNRYK